MTTAKETCIEEILAMMRANFGHAVRSCWVYAEEMCPGCGRERIDACFQDGRHLRAINGFMYHEQGVLIAYFLCHTCTNAILAHPRYEKTPLHLTIESTLIAGYQRHLASLNA